MEASPPISGHKFEALIARKLKNAPHSWHLVALQVEVC